MTWWYICIKILSAIDGSVIGEIHSPYSMPAEQCVEAIFGEAAQVYNGLTVSYECHKSENIEA